MNTKNLFLALLVISFSSAQTTADAASFNCSKATTQTEKMICSDSELGKLDEQLAGIYNEGKHIPGLKAEQRAWLAELKKCSDSACLKAAYRERLDELNSQILSFGRAGGKAEQENALKAQKENENQKAGEELAHIGRCLVVNYMRLEHSGSLPDANQAFIKKYTKAAEASVDGNAKVQACVKQGGTTEQCINQLPEGLRYLMRGYSNGVFQYNKAKRENDTAMMKILITACGS
ncbi:MAG: lysozyme inhibitor LprI family protein [Oxalobacteraceae bacterium]|jgi:uncharacterized protein|nr:lysozyme inhibitor LprI family protein [Oxalobacteraceae bacterium]